MTDSNETTTEPMKFGGIPFLNRLRRGDRVMVLELQDNGREMSMKTMVRMGSTIVDKMKNKTYIIATDSMDIAFQENVKRGRYHVYMADESSGVTCTIKKDASMFLAQTNARLTNKVLDSEFLQRAFKIKPDMIQLAIVGIVCLIAGFLIASSMG